VEAYKMKSELKRPKGGDEDQEDEVDRDVTDTLSHPSGRHLILEGDILEPGGMLCIREEEMSSCPIEGEQ
jgi:hypothetical protein